MEQCGKMRNRRRLKVIAPGFTLRQSPRRARTNGAFPYRVRVVDAPTTNASARLKVSPPATFRAIVPNGDAYAPCGVEDIDAVRRDLARAEKERAEALRRVGEIQAFIDRGRRELAERIGLTSGDPVALLGPDKWGELPPEMAEIRRKFEKDIEDAAGRSDYRSTRAMGRHLGTMI